MYCTKCGTKNSGKGLYCKKCGASLVDEVLEENDYETRENNHQRNEKPNESKKSKSVSKSNNKTKTVNKEVNKGKKDKQKRKGNNSEVKTEIIHKTSAFQKIMITFMILIIIVLLAGLLAAALYIFQDKTVEIPDVVGSNIEDATLILENMDLKVRVKNEEVEDESQNNIVLKQNKKQGEFVAKYSFIVLTVGKYKSMRLDNYVGMTKKDAIASIKRLKLKYDIKEVEMADSDGIVISQTPTQGTEYNQNTKITLTVSKKKEETSTVDKKTDEEEAVETQIEDEIDE